MTDSTDRHDTVTLDSPNGVSGTPQIATGSVGNTVVCIFFEGL